MSFQRFEMAPNPKFQPGEVQYGPEYLDEVLEGIYKEVDNSDSVEVPPVATDKFVRALDYVLTFHKDAIECMPINPNAVVMFFSKLPIYEGRPVDFSDFDQVIE